MLLVTNLQLNADFDFDNPLPYIASYLRLDKSAIKSVALYRRSVDARRKSAVHFCCSFLVKLATDESEFLKHTAQKGISLYTKTAYKPPEKGEFKNESIVIAGFGPAGMFAALTLARLGLKPTVIERGEDVDSRLATVAAFHDGGRLNTESNIQFGEGGAGTFSDGKLNTGIKDVRCRFVLEELYRHGADKDILVNAKPHIGTDVLPTVVKNIRREIIDLGGKVLFSTKLCGINIHKNRVVSIETACGAKTKTISCDRLLLCLGHSARDTFEMLKNSGVYMQQKPFAIGARIEHRQTLIDRAQLGDFYTEKAFLPTDYKLAAHLENGRGVYTFCMCPGGEVVNASSETGAICTNGMSRFARDGENANSALLVGVEPEDFGSDDPLAGIALQRQIETAAFNISGSYAAPSQKVGDFLADRPSVDCGKTLPTVKPQPHYCRIDDCLPRFITDSMREGIKIFGKRLIGFDDPEALLTSPETRSSSPVRITRNDLREANIDGIYPCGEGAGYAGGITSAAVDGIRTAEAVAERIRADI